MTEPESLPPPPFWRTGYFERAMKTKLDRVNIPMPDRARVIAARRRRQGDGRWRLWDRNEANTHWLRGVLLPDGITVHNAFPGRRFRPRTIPATISGNGEAVRYYPDTDSSHVDLTEESIMTGEEVPRDVMTYYDRNDHICAVAVESATKHP